MRNSIDYPGERAPRRPAVIAQAGYTGQNHIAEIESLLEQATPEQLKIILRFMRGIIRIEISI